MVYVQTSSGNVFETSNASYWSDATQIPAKRGKELLRKQCQESLRETLKPGDTVYTLLRDVSRTGMRRTFSVYSVQDGQLVHLTYSAAKACGYRLDKRDRIVVDGCGFDAGYHIAYSLGYALWPNGTPEPHGTRNGQPDSDGGYALKHRSL
jgi:hypothetical protein